MTETPRLFGAEWIPEEPGTPFSYEGITDTGLIAALERVEPAIQQEPRWPYSISYLVSSINPFLSAASSRPKAHDLGPKAYEVIIHALRSQRILLPVLSQANHKAVAIGFDQNRVRLVQGIIHVSRELFPESSPDTLEESQLFDVADDTYRKLGSHPLRKTFSEEFRAKLTQQEKLLELSIMRFLWED